VGFKVSFSPHAVRAFRGFSDDLKEKVGKAVEEMKRSPFHGPDIKKMKGTLKDYHRYRIGDHRILYAISKERKEVFVDYIQDRKDVYRKG